ncbi:MAG: hypothetical protein JW772_01510 [Candidatus Diapherotrites archaeon]|nr:hypothetical protein [Candidatus Diapherotrites archaeon]
MGFSGLPKVDSKKIVVLEQTENSELIEIAKPCNREFFEKLFASAGVFWSAYSELGFGEKPLGERHLVFFKNRMFFNRNVEKKFLYSVGMEKKFAVRNNKLIEKRDFSPESLLLLLASPFDFGKQVASIALAALRINESLQEFKEFSDKTKKFWLIHSQEKISNPQELANNALDGALKAMHYSFYASIAYSLKIRLKKIQGTEECELEKLANAIDSKDVKRIAREFGFYSNKPYNICVPRYWEAHEKTVLAQTAPKNPAARLRENAKFLCARYLDIERRCYLAFAEKTGLGDNVFFLQSGEFDASNPEIHKIIEERKNDFQDSLNLQAPKKIFFDKEWKTFEAQEEGIKGLSAGGKKIVEGKVVFVDSEEDYKKDAAGKIVVSKTLSPNLTTLFGKAAGIASSGGGKIAHTAIVALEQNFVCIVQAKNLGLLKEGDKIRVDGNSGEIKKIP